MGEQKQQTMSYLLRLWQTESSEKRIWRASLESARAGERQGFDTLEALFDFLRNRTAEPGNPGGGLSPVTERPLL